jgi:hypothetical protein
MKKLTSQFLSATSKVNKTHIQLVWTLLALTLLVLGAGAPDDVGGVGIR